MPSKVELMNAALRLFAGNRVVDPDEETAEAIYLSGAFNSARDTVLAAFPFSFAMKLGRLSQVQQPPFGFSYAYRLPVDCVAMVDVRATGALTEKPAEYIIVGQEIHTDIQPCLARYVCRHTEYAFWPPHFCVPFTYQLAISVAPYLAGNAGIAAKLREEFRIALDDAAAEDLRQQNPPEIDWEPAAFTARSE